LNLCDPALKAFEEFFLVVQETSIRNMVSRMEDGEYGGALNLD
jgi:hypothetical protein